MFWTGMAKVIEQYVPKYVVCISHRHLQLRELMIAHDIPARPRQEMSSNIFSLYEHNHLFVVDYYSKYPEVCLLSSKSAASVIIHLKIYILASWHTGSAGSWQYAVKQLGHAPIRCQLKFY